MKRGKYTIVAFFLIIVLAAYFVVRPFLLQILAAIILTILFYPLYRTLCKKVSPSMAALLVTIGTVILVFVPTALVISALVGETTTIVRQFQSGTLGSFEYIDIARNFVEELSVVKLLNIDIDSGIASVFRYVAVYFREQATQVPSMVLSFFVVMLLLYYLLRDGKQLLLYFYSVVPLKPKERVALEERLSTVTYAVVYGQIVTALIQGLIATIGYLIFGVKAPVLWGVVTMFFALIPYFGTAIVWLPLSLVKFFSGISDGSWWLGAALFAYSLVIVSSVDNFIRPILIGDRAKIHPAIALIGVLGGVAFFGLMGIFAGPLILALGIHVIDLALRKNAK